MVTVTNDQVIAVLNSRAENDPLIAEILRSAMLEAYIVQNTDGDLSDTDEAKQDGT